MQSNPDKVLELAQSVNVESCDAWTAYRLAKSLDQLGQMNQAILAYKRAYELFPLYSDFGAEYANALIRAKQLDAAQTVLHTLIRQQPKNEWLWLNKGLLASMQNRGTETIQAWNTLLNLNPDHLQGHLFLSEWYEKQGKMGAALIHAEAAYQSHPMSQEAENRVIRLRGLIP